VAPSGGNYSAGFAGRAAAVINTEFDAVDLRDREHRMSLISFHKVLIATAILFCAGFAVWKVNRYTGGSGSIRVAVVFCVIAVLLGFYLALLRRFLGDQNSR